MHGSNLVEGGGNVKYIHLKEPEISCPKSAGLNTADLHS